MAVQINVAANQAALTASIQAGVQAYNQRFAQNNQLNLTVNQRAFSQPLGRMTGDVKDFEAALAASNARVIAFGASTAVLGGVIRSFKELANVTIEVEKNLADINRVFGLTTSQLQKFSTDLFNVTKQTASSFDDASKAALEFSRQGLKAEETLQRTKDALTLTRLAGIGTANAVDALTSTVNGFAATGITTTQILNKLVAVEQDYAVGAGDLAEALSRTGQAAQEAGVSLDQLNALVTSAQQSTARGGAVIGNALKTIFTRLQRTDTLDQLEAFNISVRDVQGNILPAVQILQNFAGAYRGLADAQRAQLSEQVAGVYQVNILKAIVNDLNKSQGTYAGALQRGASATNEAEIATAKLNQTLDALLKQTATSTQQLANNIGKVTFEPLAKYGTEQLKSFVESMNEILEGEGVGSTFANGLLKGIRNVIAGPGAIAAFFTLFKLIQNSFTYLSQALPQIAGITTETQNRKNIEQSILQIMQQQGPASQALAGMMGNQAAQAQLLLQIARQQTAEYQMQSTLAKQLAAQLATQGVRVKGSGGLQVTRAGGYIPAATRMAEVVGAQAGGYAPGRVVSSPVGGVMNTAEDVKYIPGFAQPFINPPAGSKAGRAHRQNAISRTGVDPYMFNGFIPNFVKKSPSQFSVGRAFEQSVGFDIKVPPSRNKPIDFKEVLEKPINKNFNPKLYQSNTFADAHSGLGHTSAENISKVINHIGQNYYAYSPKQGSKTKRLKIDDKTSIISQPDVLGDLFIRPRYTEIIGEGSDVPKQIETSSISSLNTTAKKTLLNGVSELDFNPILRRKIKMQFAQDRVYGSGFIPNFATPMTTASIPWFKKYSSKYKNATGDTDLFKMGDFPTYGRGSDHEYAKKGNANMLSYLHEDFVRSALNIALGSKKVIRPSEVGFKNKPVSDIANENDFDLLYRIADGSYSMLELKQDFKNVSGSVTGFMNKKLANLEKENPVLAKKVSSMIAVSNRPKFTDPTGRNAGANFSEFEMAAASIVKDKYSNVDPSISAKLTKVTDGLLRRYEAKKNTTYGGFIPNFASMISSSIKGKGNISAIKTGKNNYEIEGVEVGKKFRGQGLGSQLYGNIAEKIGSGSTIKSVLLPQEQALADYASGKSIPAKAIFPQLSWAKMAKSSKLLINGKEIAMSDFESGIASHKYNAAKLDMALIELINSHASGFIPNFNSIKGRNSFQKNWLIETAKKRNLNLNNPDVFSKLATEFAKTYPNDQGMFGLSEGFIPNFAYKQAVMGLEESMSGEKAIFDTKPFPHIRNSSQPTFSSAIADHGGLGNALSDSMRGQKNAGLMNKGYIPNFAPKKQGKKNQTQNTQSSSNAVEVESYIENYAKEALRDVKKTYRSTVDKIKSMFSEVDSSVSSVGIDAIKSLREQTFKKGRNNEQINTSDSKGNNRFDKLSEGLSKASTAIAILGPTIAGFAEQAVFGNKKRTEMTATERSLQSGLSTGLSAVSTGAGIGAAFGPIGAGVGAATGALVGFVSALNAAELSAEDLAEMADNQRQNSQQNISAGQKYIQAQQEYAKLLASGASSDKLELASKSLSESFNQITDIKLADELSKTKGGVEALNSVLSKYETDKNILTAALSFASGVKGGKTQGGVQIGERVKELKSLGLNKDLFDQLQSFKLQREKIMPEIIPGQETVPEEIEVVTEASSNAAKRLAENIAKSTIGNKGTAEQIKIFQESILELLLRKDKEEILKELSSGNQFINNIIENARKEGNLLKLRNDLSSSILKQIGEANAQLEQDDFGRKLLDEINNFKFSLAEGILSPLSIATEKLKTQRTKTISEGQDKLTELNLNFVKENQEKFLKLNPSSEVIQSKIRPALEKAQTGDLSGLQAILQESSITGPSPFDPAIINDLKKIYEEFNRSVDKQNRSNVNQLKLTDLQGRVEQIRAKTTEFQATLLQKQIQLLGDQERIEATRKTNSELEIDAIERKMADQGNFLGRGVIGKAESKIALRNETTTKKLVDLEISRSKSAQSDYQSLIEKQQTNLTKMAAQSEFEGRPMQAIGLREQARNIKSIDITNSQTLSQAISQLQQSPFADPTLENERVRTLEKLKTVQNDIVNGKLKEEEITKRLNNEELRNAKRSTSIVYGFKEGFDALRDEADTGLNRLARDTPALFRDGMVNAIKAAVKETDNLGDALLGVAANFLDIISSRLMEVGVSKLISGSGIESLFTAQKGGVVRAQSGMYVSGTGSGDKYPAMLENGEYVLNRNAVMAMGGPAALDTLNFSAAPRFASGGSFSAELSNVKAMEDGMTTFGLENSSLYKELRDEEIRKAEEARQKKRARQAQTAQMVGSLAAAVAVAGIGAGISNKMANVKAGKAQNLSQKLQQGAPLTAAESSSITGFMNKGLLSPSGVYIGPQVVRTGFSGFTGYGRQTGGLIGSRLSDTIPGYMEGGLYNSPIVKKYGTGMQAGGMSPVANNSNTVNNSNASNSFNFNTTVNRDGNIQMGANNTSYKQQDVELSNNLNNRIYGAVLDVIRDQQRFGGSLAGTRKA